MNERIRELKQQSIDYVDSIDDGLKLDHYKELVDQKFAELIVRECLQQCSKALVEHTGQPSVTHNYAVGLCQDNIKEHFGVEE